MCLTVTFSPAFTSVLAAFNCFKLTASLSLVPSSTLVTLLPPTDKLPPEIVTAGVLAAPPGALFNVIVVPPFLIVLIPLRFLDN